MTYNVIMTSKNNKKISSIDEFDRTSGKKIRTVNHCLYKSIDEYDEKTGKKVRTINFNSKDESKISSVQEYDIDTGKIISISIYKRDGKTVGIVKKFDNDSVMTYHEDETDSDILNDASVSQYDIPDLINSLYSDNHSFTNIMQKNDLINSQPIT